MKAKCEICEKEIESGLNFFGLFGQNACSSDCMEKLTARQNAETANEFHQSAKGEKK